MELILKVPIQAQLAELLLNHVNNVLHSQLSILATRCDRGIITYIIVFMLMHQIQLMEHHLGTGYASLVCGGDSGGGDLFWTGSKWILLSEHTYGPNSACGTFYSFYLPNGATNVSAYYDWIQSIIKDPTPAVNCKNGTIANCVTNG